MYAATFEKDGQAESLAPDELANDDEISFEISAKTKLTLLIYPQFAAWNFPEKQTTITLIDLDTHKVGFYGRVTDVQDSMDNSDKYCRRITCANEMDFLDDTRTALTFPSDTSTMTIAQSLIDAHNAKVDDTRKFVMGTVVQRFTANAITFDYCTTLEALKKVFIDTYGFEIRTRHVNGVNCFDASMSFGEESETAIVIGDNLQQIRATYSAADRLVTRLIPLGGVGYDGKRLTIEQAEGNTSGNIYIDNPDMMAKYGIHEGTLVINELAPQYYGQRAKMAQELYEIGLEEAAALGTRSVQIALSASDLQKLGYSGYDSFALGNTHYTVCPKLGIFRDLRITGLKRKLADPSNVSITISAAATKRREVKVLPLSRQIADYASHYDSYISEVERKQVEQIDLKLEDRLDKLKFTKLTKPEYEELKELGELDEDTVYTVTDEDPETGEPTAEQYLGGIPIAAEGGGVSKNGIPYPQTMDFNAFPREEAVLGFAAKATREENVTYPTWVAGGITPRDGKNNSASGYQRTEYIAYDPDEVYFYIGLRTEVEGASAKSWAMYAYDSSKGYLGEIATGTSYSVTADPGLIPDNTAFLRFTTLRMVSGGEVRQDAVVYRR